MLRDTLTPKQRVLMAMEHREPDRVPLDFAALPQVVRGLCDFLAVDPSCDWSRYQSYPEALLQRLHVDLRIVRAPSLAPAERPAPGGGYFDLWGVEISPEGYPVGHPLADVTSVADIESYTWPDPDALDYEHYAETCQRYEEYAVCGGDWSPFWTWSLELMGSERLMINLRERPEVAHALLRRVADYYYETSRRLFEAGHGRLDIFFMGDDYGTQRGPFLSPRDFRTFIVPHLTRLYGLAKSYGLKVMQHSCGSVRAVLPDMIAAGLDALDPVQPRASGMDPAGLKASFGHQVTFHGTLDLQDTLPHGSVEDVRREVLGRIEHVGPGGGLIIGNGQDYISDVPLENIVAVYDTVYDYGCYGRRWR
jgi:uroporphyrinogen decarboxylase